ncbi:gp39 [Burkholderia phage KS14]|uniref:Gp39 n=1 Tax=Burkholderia phage KS14 TaxID=910475 RepID=E5FFJ2_9CAUD|nr:gp39 [Burkholderia phage KS14]ADP02384.1 gp39 [Burkholderia phage KS14]
MFSREGVILSAVALLDRLAGRRRREASAQLAASPCFILQSALLSARRAVDVARGRRGACRAATGPAMGRQGVRRGRGSRPAYGAGARSTLARISQSPLRAWPVLGSPLLMRSSAGRPSALRQGLRGDFEAAGVMRFDARELRFELRAGRMNRQPRKSGLPVAGRGGRGDFREDTRMPRGSA